MFRTLRTIWIFGDCDRIEIFDSTDFYDLFFFFFVLSSNKPSVDAGLFYSLLYLPMLMLFIMVRGDLRAGRPHLELDFRFWEHLGAILREVNCYWFFEIRLGLGEMRSYGTLRDESTQTRFKFLPVCHSYTEKNQFSKS